LNLYPAIFFPGAPLSAFEVNFLCVLLDLTAYQEPVALVDFCAMCRKNPDYPACCEPLVRRSLQGKNRLSGDFWKFYARSATN
jgi:hypothetical protein